MSPRGWFRRRNRRDDLSEEIQSHLDEKTDALMARGLSRADAEREARRVFGNVTNVQEAAGDVWRVESFLENIASDARYAVRGLIQKPGFTIAVILTLALGIGANAVVFALVNAVVLRPLSYPNADRIVSIAQRSGMDGRDGRALQDFVYLDWARATRLVESHAAYAETQAVFGSPDGKGPARIMGMSAPPAYFSIFGVRPLIGRLFDESETQPGEAPVVVLSEQLWRERFDADSSIVGKRVTVDGASRLVIGVLPASFTYGRAERFWTPFRVTPRQLVAHAKDGEVIAYPVVARLRHNATVEALRVELVGVLGRLAPQGLGLTSATPIVMTLHERRHGETRRPLLLLFGAVGVLLLTACANIANLALARATRREREFALRLALGASRWRIVRFVLIENLALAAGGTALGLLLVSFSLAWFVRISPGSIQAAEHIGVSGALIAYASVVAIVTAMLFGLVPALSASRVELNRTLSGGTPHAAGSKRQSFARHALVVGELAIALVFLTGAGLVAKTFWRVTSIDPGFRPEKLLVAAIELRPNRYTVATAKALFDDLMARARREPGVQRAAYAVSAPMAGGGAIISVQMAAAKGAGKLISKHREVPVEPEYLESIGGRLVAGRFFEPEDRLGAPRVAVVSEDYVKVNLGGASPIGRTVGGGKERATIVGVVKDIAQEATDGPSAPLVFLPLAQWQGEGKEDLMARQLIIRTTGESEQLEGRIRQALQALDPLQPPPTFKTMKNELAERVAPRRFVLVLLVAFAALAGGLAVIGLYSVLAYLVAERTREIGVRIAVGADSSRVTRMVLGQGLRFTIIGIALGGAISIASVRLLRAWMYEMSVYDGPTFVAVGGLLLVVALFASWLPARRASRVDPMIALRAD